MTVLHIVLIFRSKIILIIVVVEFLLWVDIIKNLYISNIQSYIYYPIKLFFLIHLYIAYINYNSASSNYL